MPEENNLSDIPFTQFEFDSRLLQALSHIGLEYCTPIQAAALPKLLVGKSVAGQAQTGTGKTAAYLLALFNRLLLSKRECRDGYPRAVIISPTRELAIQIYEDSVKLSQYTDLVNCVIYGGVGYEQQSEDLSRPVDLLIATPGRLIDYYKQGVIKFNDVQAIVLDEADRMFDLGFVRDIRYLLRKMPKMDKTLNMLFSATLSHRVMELTYEYMDEPILIRINPEQLTVDKVQQSLYHVANEEKILLLLGLIENFQPVKSIIFVNTKRTAEHVWGYLKGNGLKTVLLSGDVPQQRRQKLFSQFLSGEMDILVATDVAARGLHISDVSHVFNYDLPQNREDYVHRIGRTARAGAQGMAVSFACEQYVYSLVDIENYIGFQIPTMQVRDEILCVAPKPPIRWTEQRVRDKRAVRKS